MFLAVGGLAFASHAVAQGRGNNWQYYAAGQSSYRISDDDDGPAPTSANAQSVVARAGGQQHSTGQEQNALYVADGTGVGSGVMQTNFLGGDCGCNNCGGGNGSCISDCMGDCDCSCNAFRLEWLGWFTRGRNTPPLVTTSPGGTASTDAGVLGLPTTSVIYGNDPIGTSLRNGLRATFSHMFNDGATWGTFRFWGIEDGSETFAINSTNNPIIARPFFNATPLINANDSFLVAYPGIAGPGSIRVLSKNDLIGADAWLSRNWYNDGASSVDVLGGYQFTRLDDSIVINTSQVGGPAATFPGTQVDIRDSFRTQNQFHGGSVGLIGRSYRGVVTLEALGKIGLGNMHQAVIVNGSNTITAPGGGPVTNTGGLFATGTNSGSFSRDRLAFVPEINVNLLYNINQSWRLIGGYSFIYWSNVVLAGNQIDTNINATQIGGALNGPAVPARRFQRSDFWVQGINLGAEYRW